MNKEVEENNTEALKEEQQHKRFNCFYHNQAYLSYKEGVQHIDSEHPGKLYYPTPEDFEKRLL